VKRRWKVLITLGGVLLAGIVAPMLYIEGRCRAPLPGFSPAAPYRSLVAATDRRPEARTWLTYPEWHIVYSADSFGQHLAAKPPSGYGYWRDVKGFWTSYCLLNRATGGSTEARDAKVMIYTIGVSFTFELGIRALYENSIGRLFEWISGWHSPDDLYAARVQQIYGAFMHQTPWYRFPFGRALRNEWRIGSGGAPVRHWERRVALSAEYGVKAGYAKLIDTATGATLGRDQLTLRFVARATPEALAALDGRLQPIRQIGKGLTEVEAPRYAEFTDLIRKMAARQMKIVEIAGNDDIFATFLVPDKLLIAPLAGTRLIDLPLGDRPGWRRIGLSTKVTGLMPLIRTVQARGGSLDHVYDY
jgi:hypothetical protein